jgi:hypothetical protein
LCLQRRHHHVPERPILIKMVRFEGVIHNQKWCCCCDAKNSTAMGAPRIVYIMGSSDSVG